jgi:hypothetical protein
VTESQYIEAILQHWEDGWEALHPADPEDPDHVPWFTRNESSDTAESWVRIVVNPSLERQSSFGGEAGSRWTTVGNIAVQIYVPVNAGDGVRAELADDVRTVLRGKSIYAPNEPEPVSTFGASTTDPVVESAWNTCTVVVRYRVDAIG